MKRLNLMLPVLMVLELGLTLQFADAQTAHGSSRAKLSTKDVEEMMTTLSNWGRWGKDDELGALNLITPGKRKEAAAQVKEGVSVSLARDLAERQRERSRPVCAQDDLHRPEPRIGPRI